LCETSPTNCKQYNIQRNDGNNLRVALLLLYKPLGSMFSNSRLNALKTGKITCVYNTTVSFTNSKHLKSFIQLTHGEQEQMTNRKGHYRETLIYV